MDTQKDKIKDLIKRAKSHYRSREYDKALEFFSEAAELGDAMAQYFTGSMYESAEGTPLDYEQAVYWYSKTAEKGDKSAQWRIGTMYRDGEGIAADLKQSAYWFKKAREQG